VLGAGALLAGQLLAADRAESHGCRAEHDHESGDADEPQAADRAAHEHRDADREHEPGEDRLAARSLAQRGAAQGGSQLRVLFDERALHLLEQSQLLFGEWHRSSTRAVDGRSSMVEPQV
jgi:hypothetical protein